MVILPREVAMSRSDKGRFVQNQRGKDVWTKAFMKRERRSERQRVRRLLHQGVEPEPRRMTWCGWWW